MNYKDFDDDDFYDDDFYNFYYEERRSFDGSKILKYFILFMYFVGVLFLGYIGILAAGYQLW